jgi:hypothetical protein
MRKFTKYPSNYVKASTRRSKLVPLSDWRYLSKGDTIIYKGSEFDGSWELPAIVKDVQSDGAIARVDDGTGSFFEVTIDNDTLGYFYEEL